MSKSIYVHRTHKVSKMVHDPYVLEFLELEDNEHYYEGDFEQAIIDHLQKFFLEMGRDFTFVGRQVHLVIGKKHYHIDLVLLTSFCVAMSLSI